jgi:hypothetical protein
MKHIGSARTLEERTALDAEAVRYAEAHRVQRPLFGQASSRLLHLDHATLMAVTHRFAREALHACAHRCGLSFLHVLYRDLALMRLLEPTSKLRSIELIGRYFGVSYAERTVYRLLPRLIEHRGEIERAAATTARSLGDAFALVLYDVTTLYFETSREDDLRKPGFSKDDKSKQPQIVVGLLVTSQGFPLAHDVFHGKTFEGHTMLSVVERFESVHGSRPIIVADAAMLSQENMRALAAEGYRFIVGARLASASPAFIEQVTTRLPRQHGALLRLPYVPVHGGAFAVVCSFSADRYRKDKREFDRQVKKAKVLVAENEPGRRAKFVRKSGGAFPFDEALCRKAEHLLGIKGYCTNIPEADLSDAGVVSCYHELWRIEQSFRMSKSDLETRPIFHRTEDAIRAHVLLCFTALMLLKYLEINTGYSPRKIRDLLWSVHEAHIRDELTGRTHVLRSSMDEYRSSALHTLLREPETH